MTLAIAIILSLIFGTTLGIVGAGLLAAAKHADTRPLYDNCPGCGATMIPGLPIEHELGCRYGLTVESAHGEWRVH